MRRFASAVGWLLLGGLITLGALELVFRLLPVADGRIRVRDESRWPLHNYVGPSRFTYSFGWDLRNVQHGAVNGFGQVAPFDFTRGRAKLAVFGDSYVESAMNAYDDTLHAQVAQRLGDRQAAIGVAANGLSLADYTVAARQTAAELAPAALAFLIIDGDIAEATRPRRGWHHFTAGADGRLQPRLTALRSADDSPFSGLLSGSSMYQYLRRNLAWTPPQPGALIGSLSGARPAAAPADPQADARGRLAVDAFVETTARDGGVEPRCIALLLDSDRPVLYGEKPAVAVDSADLRRHLAERARAAGFVVVDLAPVFAEHYRVHRQRFDYTPTDRHWNALGHRLAAQALLDGLRHCPAIGGDTAGAAAPPAANGSSR